MSRIVSLAMVVLLALLADSAAAHDYWLSPQTYLLAMARFACKPTREL